MLIYQAVVTALLAAREQSADLLRLMPRLEAAGVGEALLLARMPLTFAGFLPQGLVMGRRWPLVAGALGKFLLFRRETYLRIGGHEAVRTDIVEDMQLSRLVKRHGGRLMWCDGTALARARPYHGLGEAWRGIAKSSFAAIDYSLAALVLGIPAVAAVLLAPYGFAVAGIIGRRTEVVLLWLPLAQVALLWVSCYGCHAMGVIPADLVALPVAAAHGGPARGDDFGDHAADHAVGPSGAAGGWGGMEGADLPLQQHAAAGGAENRTTLGCRGRAAGSTARDRRAPAATGLALGPGRTASGGDPHTGGWHGRCPGGHRAARARESVDASGGPLVGGRSAGPTLTRLAFSPLGWACGAHSRP